MRSATWIGSVLLSLMLFASSARLHAQSAPHDQHGHAFQPPPGFVHDPRLETGRVQHGYARGYPVEDTSFIVLLVAQGEGLLGRTLVQSEFEAGVRESLAASGLALQRVVYENVSWRGESLTLAQIHMLRTADQTPFVQWSLTLPSKPNYAMVNTLSPAADSDAARAALLATLETFSAEIEYAPSRSYQLGYLMGQIVGQLLGFAAVVYAIKKLVTRKTKMSGGDSSAT